MDRIGLVDPKSVPDPVSLMEPKGRIDRRALLAGVLALSATSAFAKPAAMPALDADLLRLDPARLRLTWSDPAAKLARVYLSERPDAPPRAMRLLAQDLAGGTAELQARAEPRPYFLLQAGPGRSTRVAERLLPLQGARNFRDLGGYRAADGRQVRWGQLYRSDSMTGLTAQDLTYLQKLNIGVVCDLRSQGSLESAPSALAGSGTRIVTFPYELDASLGPIMRAKTRSEAIDGFAASYVSMADILAPNFQDMFARLVRGETPLAYNCSAGKDRTGMASALILSVLGVPRETVVRDYALSEQYMPVAKYLEQMAAQAHASKSNMVGSNAMAQLPPDVLNVLLGTDPEIMRKALAQLDATYGGPVGYAKAKLGLDDAKIRTLKRLYLV